MILDELQAAALIGYAVEAAPYEACGLIAGRGHTARWIIPIANIASEPQQYYEMDQRAFVEAMFAIQRRSLKLIGIYHSHPKDAPIPSKTDIRQAHYPEVEYLIISLRGETPCLAAWRVHDHEVESLEVSVGALAISGEKPAQLSDAQKAAIIVSALLALLAVIVISLALLPPAPVITR